MGAVRRALQVREVGPDGRAVTRVVAVLHPYRVPEDSAEALEELLQRLVVPRAVRVHVLVRVAVLVDVAVEDPAASGPR